MATLTVPQAIAGTHTLIAVGQTSGKTASTAFQVKPAITLVARVGTAGSRSALTGMGFGAGETVEVLWYPGAKCSPQEQQRGRQRGPVRHRADESDGDLHRGRVWAHHHVVCHRPCSPWPRR